MVHQNEEFIAEIWPQVLPTKMKRNKNSVHSLLQFEELVMAVALEVLFSLWLSLYLEVYIN